MYKKLILILFIFSAGLWSCCTGIPELWDIEDFQIGFKNDSGVTLEEGTFSNDSLEMSLTLDVSYVSSVSFENLFINSAYALSCEPDGYNGMNDGLSNITFTSNNDFNNIDAGNSLNDIMIAKTYSNTMSLETFLGNIKTDYALSNFDFLIMEKPTNNSKHQFTITMEFDSGKSIVVTSKEITWN